MNTLFETRALCKTYRRGTRAEVHALADVSLTIERGSFTLLAGPSGSGKTTLLALLGALDRPTAGQVVFDGRALTSLSDVELARVRRRFGFVFQNFALIAGLPAWENVTYPLIPRGVARTERRTQGLALLAQFGLADRAGALARELSTGEQQRVAFARALAGKPEVVLADEPTASLDIETGRAIQEVLRQLSEQGTTVIVSSHDAALRERATAVYELEKGRLRTEPRAPATGHASSAG